MYKLKKNVILILLSGFGMIQAQEYVPSKENIEAREWFEQARFGMFIHWGLYSVLAGGGRKGYAEWIQNRDFIPGKDYKKLTNFFYPRDFDPVEWVRIAKDAGMKYITFTTKHHEGFSMFDTKYSDFGVMQTPYGKDVLKMLKDECDKQGIKLFVYYSLLDWHHPDYYPWGRSGREFTGRTPDGDWDNYIKFMNDQLTELLTGYGEIGGVWFDGMWDKKDADWHLEDIYGNIHKLQPQALIGNNHHQKPLPGEDFQMFERDLPGENTFGHNTTHVSRLPLETCETMNREWGYNFRDNDFKTPEEIIDLIVRAAGNNANLLLNTGPMPDGNLIPENVATLKKVGSWMRKYGETIYGSAGGPVKPDTWGATTQKDNRIFVHVLNYDKELLALPPFVKKIKKSYLFDNGEKIDVDIRKEGIILNLKNTDSGKIDRIVVLETEK
ncbi:MAG: alpha-L-fucosidase [Chlorobi bacterium]|nr:alpha-L-fucosidase [Chlorobiota bacterium]